jgi:hypothetical protein
VGVEGAPLTLPRLPPGYNAVNGVPSCANEWLLGTLLRDSWEFDGYVTSDCDADSDVFYSHHYTPTPEQAVPLILAAGTDVDCGGFMTANAPKALANGNITEEDMNVVLRRLFRVRIRLGHFDPVGASPLDKIGAESVCNGYALELARDGVRQSAVLAKNDAGLLPLSAAAINSAVVIGPKCVVRAVGPLFFPLLRSLTIPTTPLTPFSLSLSSSSAAWITPVSAAIHAASAVSPHRIPRAPPMPTSGRLTMFSVLFDPRPF